MQSHFPPKFGEIVLFSGGSKNIAGETTVPFFPVVIFSGRNWCSHFNMNTNYGTYNRKNYYRKKRYSRLASYVFRRIQITTGKYYDLKKKIDPKTIHRNIMQSQFLPKFGGNWLHIIFRRIVQKKKNQSQNNPPENNVVPVPAKIWWDRIFSGGSKNIAGQTTCTFFSGCNFFKYHNWCSCQNTNTNYDPKKLRPEEKWYSHLAGYVFWLVQITTGKSYDRKKKLIHPKTIHQKMKQSQFPQKILQELAPYYFPADCFIKKNQSQNNPPEVMQSQFLPNFGGIIIFSGDSKNIASNPDVPVPFFSGRNFFGS